MAWKLNRGLPSLNVCVITWIGNGICAETLFCTEKNRTLQNWFFNEEGDSERDNEEDREMARHRERLAVFRGLSFEEKIWQVPVHPWHGLLLICCASVLCVVWKTSSFLSLAASFLSLFFLPSPLHLHNPRRGFGQSAWKRYSLEFTFFFWHERHCV